MINKDLEQVKNPSQSPLVINIRVTWRIDTKSPFDDGDFFLTERGDGLVNTKLTDCRLSAFGKRSITYNF